MDKSHQGSISSRSFNRRNKGIYIFKAKRACCKMIQDHFASDNVDKQENGFSF